MTNSVSSTQGQAQFLNNGRKRWIIVSIVVVFLGIVGVANVPKSDVAGPKAVIEDIFAKAKMKTLASDSALQSKVSANVNFSKMSQSILGSRWSSTAKGDQQWFTETITQLITLTVYPKAFDFLNGVKISYIDEFEEGGTATITSEIEKKGEITEVKYTLQKHSGAWAVTDIAIDDESWVESIKEEVNSVIEESKWAGLKNKMTSRLNELKKK